MTARALPDMTPPDLSVVVFAMNEAENVAPVSAS